MWQMRPGSSFLKSLHNSVIPPNLKIWSLYSPNDKLARGESGQLRPTGGLENFIKIQMPEYGHFDFILRRGPIKEVIKILRDDPNVAKSLDQEDETPLARLSGDDDGADEAG